MAFTTKELIDLINMYGIDGTHLDPNATYTDAQLVEYMTTKQYGIDVRPALSLGLQRALQIARRADANADEAIEVMNAILDESFDSVQLDANFAQRLDEAIANLQPDWVVFKDTVEKNINDIFLSDPIKSINFEGSDFEVLQQMFDKAIEEERPMEITRHFDITGHTIMLNKGQFPRIPINIYGGGKIKKLDEGFFFSTTFTETGDLKFHNITLEGNNNNTVFDCDDAKIIRVTTELCYQYRINHLYKSNTYLQTIKSINDTIIGGSGYLFDFNGCYDLRIEGMLDEERTGGIVGHRGVGTVNAEAISLSIVRSTLEGTKGLDPVVKLNNTFGFVFDDNYLEGNNGGHVVFEENAIERGVTISNNVHEGDADKGAMIVHSRNANTVISYNNKAKNIPIHDLSKTIAGFVQSKNDRRSFGSPANIVVDPLRLYIEEDNINRMQERINLENQLTNSTFATLEDWDGVNADLTNPSVSPINVLKVKGRGTSNNAFARHRLKSGVTTGDKIVLMLEARSYTLESFSVLITNAANGATLGTTTITPTKLNEFEEFVVTFNITLSNIVAHIALYPKQTSNSANGERDFSRVATYIVPKDYPLNSLLKYAGYSVHKTGQSVNKLDANGDGVADIPSGTKRPVLGRIHKPFPFWDDNLNKPIWWDGVSWRDANGTIV